MLDPIIEIVSVGEDDTIDIEVSGDHLFYCNGILTHNSGQHSNDVNLENVGESHGISATADIMFAIMAPEELQDSGVFLVKQLKNRDNDVTRHRKFVIGVDRAKMRLYHLDETAQSSMVTSLTKTKKKGKKKDEDDDTPEFDKTKFGSRTKKEKDDDDWMF